MKTQLRVALAQVNPCVGDIDFNSSLILEYARIAAEKGAQIVVFPEMVVTGYPVEDLALRKSFRKASQRAIEEIAQHSSEVVFDDLLWIVGYLDEAILNSDESGKPLGAGAPQNAVAIIHNGEIKARYIKQHLPNYGVFDEFRNFVAGDSSLILRYHGVDIGIAICEDIWPDTGAVATLSARKPGLVLVPNGSPYERNKDDVRLKLVSKRAKQMSAPIVYVNMTGGQDDLVFDGDSIVVDKSGTSRFRAPQFEDCLELVDIEVESETSEPDVVISTDVLGLRESSATNKRARLDDLSEVWQALVVGLRDYVKKNGFRTAGIALSGGIDSALVSVLAVDALGSENVYCFGLPSKYSSEHSLEDAKQFATNTGVHFSVIDIEPIISTFVKELQLKGIAEENVQARVRGTTMMGLSNQFGHLILATGNKSELAVGYSTLYGDAVGGFAPIKDLYKTEVWALSRWRNSIAIERGEVAPIPVNSIEKEPSAELRPDQKDSDFLPEYHILDEVLVRYIDDDEGAASLINSGLNPELVMRVISLVDRAEYKRRQYPPGTKVSRRAFGKDRRLPMTSHWNERN